MNTSEPESHKPQYMVVAGVKPIPQIITFTVVVMDFEGKRKLAIQRLAEEIVNGRLCVFLGAGCSVEAGLPSWGGLMDKLKDKFDIKTAESDFLRVAARIEKKAGKAAARRAVVDLLKTRPNLKTELQIEIARLPVSIYITTNYDHLLEDAIRQAGTTPVVVRDPKDISFIDRKTKNVVKLHGDIVSPSSMVFTKMDYTLYSKDKTPFVEWLNSILLNHVVVFLGTSFDDSRLGAADDHILNLLGDFRLNPFIFFKAPEQEKSQSIDGFNMEMEDFQARCDEFEERGFVVIPLPSWKQLPEILSDIGNLSQQIQRRKNPEEDRNTSIIQSGRIGDLEEQVAGLLDEKTKRLCESIRPQGGLLPYMLRMEKADQLNQYLQEKATELKPASLIEGYLALADAYAVPEGPEDIVSGRSFYRKAAALLGKVEVQTPWANRLLRCHAKLLFMEGHEEEAIETVANSEDPRNISLWLALLIDSGRFEPAKDLVGRQKVLHPSWAGQAIAALIVTGSVDEAEKHFEDVLEDYEKQQNEGALKEAGYEDEHYPIRLFYLTAYALFERALEVSGAAKPIKLLNIRLNEEGKSLCSKSLDYIDRLYGLNPRSGTPRDETMAMAMHLDLRVSALLLMYTRADKAVRSLVNVRPVKKDVASFMLQRADYHKKEHLDVLRKNLVQDHKASAWAWQQVSFIQAFYLDMVEEAWESISKASEYISEQEENDHIAQLAFDMGENSQDRVRADLIIERLLEKDAPILTYFEAERLLKDGDPVQAEMILLALLKESPEEPFRSLVLLSLSRAAEKQNEWKKAIEYLDDHGSQIDRMQRMGGERGYFLHKLHLYAQIQDNTAILRTVQQIESMGMEDENVLYAKAQAAHNLQKFDMEEQTCHRLYKQFGHKPLYAKQRADALFWMGRAEEAMGALAPHIHNNDSLDLDCLGLAAQIKSTTEKFDDAFFPFGSMLGENPGCPRSFRPPVNTWLSN